MNKLIYLIIGSISLLVLLIGVTTYVQNTDPVTIKPEVIYTDFSVTLPNSNGSSVVIENNFLNDVSVSEDEQNPGLFFLGNSFMSEPGSVLPAYVINYEKNSGFFNITLLQKPLSQSRITAEAYLTGLLNLDQKKLCAISYMVSVPGYVDEEASGTDYRFSFCPGSVVLP